ncbi:MAG: isoaspartyl peptidase/L-asparaginase [Myxococcales bacterium]|nr:isoaspartyl peptidase/L-asparaginase [Myxococcales bacterium]
MTKQSVQPAVVVHGGAFSIPERWRAPAAAACRAAAETGHAVLMRGGSALDAVCAAIRVLEDAPVLNAGCGAVTDAAGHVRLDASVMRGADLACGAVASIPPTLHPIDLALAVLEHSPHILLVGDGALAWGADYGVLPCTEADLRPPDTPSQDIARGCDTVGAIAIDAHGRLAAGTSTGGTPDRHPARVGDAPLIGCGTYCDDHAGAASATGWGEAIIRVSLGRAAVDAMRAGEPPETASRRLLAEMGRRINGHAGLITLDRLGRVGVAHTTPQMAWGLARGGDVRSGWQVG